MKNDKSFRLLSYHLHENFCLHTSFREDFRSMAVGVWVWVWACASVCVANLCIQCVSSSFLPCFVGVLVIFFLYNLYTMSSELWSANINTTFELSWDMNFASHPFFDHWTTKHHLPFIVFLNMHFDSINLSLHTLMLRTFWLSRRTRTPTDARTHPCTYDSSDTIMVLRSTWLQMYSKIVN